VARLLPGRNERLRSGKVDAGSLNEAGIDDARNDSKRNGSASYYGYVKDRAQRQRVDVGVVLLMDVWWADDGSLNKEGKI
jgi:hypothetical protein